MNAALLDADTQPVPTVKLPRVTRTLPIVTPQIRLPQIGRDLPPMHFNILDVRLGIDVVQRRLLTNLHFVREAQGTLVELQQRLCMPFQAGDLYALWERGYVKLGRHGDVWFVEVAR